MKQAVLGAFWLVGLAACASDSTLPAVDRVAATVSPAGGRVVHGSGAIVIVPPEALAQPTLITVELTTTPSPAALGAEPAGPALLLGPEGQTFARPVTVVVPFEAARVPTGAHARLVVMTAPRGGTAWRALESAVDPPTSTVRAEVTGFSAFVAALRRPDTDASPPPPRDAAAPDAPTRLADAARPIDAFMPRDLGAGPEAPVGRDVAAPPARLAISPMEAVNRLARFLWKTAPDQTLLAQAAAGRPSTTDEVQQIAADMLKDPRARDLPANFVVWWLGLDRLARVNLDAQTFPRWNAALRDAMAMETRLFATHVAFDGDGRLATLLSAPFSFVNGALAAHYGLPAPAGASFQRADLPPAQRAGLLTQGAALAVTSYPRATSPTRRGILVRERLLCQALPSHPPDVPIQPIEPEPGLTRREQYSRAISDPACAGCHALMDRIGFGLEHYDASGAYRTTEAGRPVDASGEIAGIADGRFVGGPDLARKLAASPEVRRCFATKWLEYALGRPPRDTEERSVDQIVSAIGAEAAVRAAIVAAAATPAFLAP